MANITLPLSQLKNYRDDFKLITQNDKDGGDSSCRAGILYTLLALNDAHSDDQGRLILGGFRADLTKYTESNGIFRRHPDPTKWYSFSGCFSRDQHSQLLLAAAALKDRRSLWNLTKRFFLRVGVHQNTYDMGPTSKRKIPDIMTPGELSCILRGFTLNRAMLILTGIPILACDVLALLDNVFRTANKKWGQDNLIAARLMFELHNYPSPVTYLNRAIYRHTDYQYQLTRYYTNENNNGIPPLGDIYVAISKEIIG
jgi:hypothetical protein